MVARRAVAGLVLALGVAPIVACTSGPGSPAPTLAGGTAPTTASGAGSAPIIEVAVGECFDAPGFRNGAPVRLETIEVHDCVADHDNEVFAVLTHGALPGADYPGDEPLRAYALDSCLGKFEDYVGVPYEQSSLDFATVWPTEPGWASGDRRIVCFLYDADFQQLHTSMHGLGL